MKIDKKELLKVLLQSYYKKNYNLFIIPYMHQVNHLCKLNDHPFANIPTPKELVPAPKSISLEIGSELYIGICDECKKIFVATEDWME